jgi:hypothetical protein
VKVVREKWAMIFGLLCAVDQLCDCSTTLVAVTSRVIVATEVTFFITAVLIHDTV